MGGVNPLPQEGFPPAMLGAARERRLHAAWGRACLFAGAKHLREAAARDQF